MNAAHILRTLPVALLALLAAPLQAQDPLTAPAPGRAGPAGPAGSMGLPEKVPGGAGAGLPETTQGATDVPATRIIRELAPFAGGNPGAPVVVQTPRGAVATDAARAIDLTVFFAYDSARVLPEALPQLALLARALNAPELRPHGFLIAGHTDAKGSEAYNLDLSARRALAVRDHLVAAHGVAPDRLVAHGWGEARLKLPSDPQSGVNRRVEVSLILPRQAVLLRPSGLVDPRHRLASDALDDFHATPTHPAR